MKRRTRLIVGITAAALTFGILTATIGPAGYHHHCASHCYSSCSKSSDDPNSKPSSTGVDKSEVKTPVSE